MVFFARLPSGSIRMLNLIIALVTGLGAEIGLKLLNRSKGPAINMMMPNCPKPPNPSLKNH